MSWRKVLRQITEKFHCCSKCGRPHTLYHMDFVPEEFRDKLRPIPCHLRFHPKTKTEKGYIGSFVFKGKTCDTYDYKINARKVFITIKKKAEEEAKETEKIDLADPYENYEYFQQLDDEEE